MEWLESCVLWTPWVSQGGPQAQTRRLGILWHYDYRHDGHQLPEISDRLIAFTSHVAPAARMTTQRAPTDVLAGVGLLGNWPACTPSVRHIRARSTAFSTRLWFFNLISAAWHRMRGWSHTRLLYKVMLGCNSRLQSDRIHVYCGCLQARDWDRTRTVTVCLRNYPHDRDWMVWNSVEATCKATSGTDHTGNKWSPVWIGSCCGRPSRFHYQRLTTPESRC